MTDDELQEIEVRLRVARVDTSDDTFGPRAAKHVIERDAPALIKEARRAVAVIRAIIDASDQCQGHADCAHSMKPWFDARELLYQFDNEQEALAELRSRAAHERYRE